MALRKMDSLTILPFKTISSPYSGAVTAHVKHSSVNPGLGLDRFFTNWSSFLWWLLSKDWYVSTTTKVYFYWAFKLKTNTFYWPPGPFWITFGLFITILTDYCKYNFRNDDGKIFFDEIEEVYRWIIANFPNCKGFLPVNDFIYECKRRYDANENGFLTYEEGRELCFTLGRDLWTISISWQSGPKKYTATVSVIVIFGNRF